MTDPPPDVPVPSDADIVLASLRRPERFAELFDRHAATIHRYAARRAGPGVADDVMADTFLAAFEARRRFDPTVASARPWLYGIATRLIARRAREEDRRWRAYARLPVEPPETHDDAAAARADSAVAGPALARALGAMRPAERDVLLLHAWADLTYDEIAHALDVPIGTVRSRLSRARARLRAELAHLDPADPLNPADPSHQPLETHRA